MNPLEILWNSDLELVQQCDGYIITGGFSYEDRSRAGVIASLEPIIDVLKNESKKGKPIFGICNLVQTQCCAKWRLQLMKTLNS